jgi:hypothetical protein
MTEPSVPAQHKHFAVFASTREQGLSILGAILVLLGFLVNDGIRERTKEMSSSLAAAKAALPIQQRIIGIQEDTAAIRKTLIGQPQLRPADLTRMKQDHVGRVLLRIEAAGNTTNDFYEKDVARFESIREGLIDLPTRPEAKKRMEDLEQLLRRTQQLQDETMNALALGFADVNSLGPKDAEMLTDEQKKQELAATAFWNYANSAMRFKSDVQRFSDSVLNEITQLNKEEQRKMRWANFASYLLFFIGWALGPLGKALNIPGLQS